MFDCVVIGAGQAGLATSYHLNRLGVLHVVLERGRVAETWGSARWDSFCLNTPNWCTLAAATGTGRRH
jgi:putative flavoprotein involved in K+ transport